MLGCAKGRSAEVHLGQTCRALLAAILTLLGKPGMD